MTPQLLLRVEKCVNLTGLGVLLFPADTAPTLADFNLHTALVLRLHPPTGPDVTTVATVEEVARPEDVVTPVQRVLLLTQEGATPPPAGTEAWWTGEEPEW